MRAYYSEYVQHCMRFYARHPRPKFTSDADKQNWYACENALKGFSQTERDIILGVYQEGDTISSNVYRIANANAGGSNQEAIWKLINTLERKIAKRRGLL